MKYIIEIEDKPFESDGKTLYRAIECKPYDESEAERQGAEKIWGIVRKIVLSVGDGGMTTSEIEECFDCDDFTDVAKMPYEEVVERYEAWTNRRDEIRVGDEIENFAMDHEKGIVIEIDEKRARGFNLAGRYYFNWNVKEVHKTGRHFTEIGKFMRKMRKTD